jgi:hypothetical protein
MPHSAASTATMPMTGNTALQINHANQRRKMRLLATHLPRLAAAVSAATRSSSLVITTCLLLTWIFKKQL